LRQNREKFAVSPGRLRSATHFGDTLSRVAETDWRTLAESGRGVSFQEPIDTAWRVMGLATQRAGAYSDPGLCQYGLKASLATQSSRIDR